jgi:hypothetical protein
MKASCARNVTVIYVSLCTVNTSFAAKLFSVKTSRGTEFELDRPLLIYGFRNYKYLRYRTSVTECILPGLWTPEIIWHKLH